MKTINEIKTELELIKETIVLAEKWWDETNGADHAVFNNDLYDMEADLEEELKLAMRRGKGVHGTSELVSANID